MIWPADTRESQKAHALKHVRDLDYAIGLCKKRRRAVQAGGNVGLWPIKMAAEFELVWTFEPDPICFECLYANVRDLPNVITWPHALGAELGTCGIERRSLGSHRLTEEGDIPMVNLDTLCFREVDLLQLDIEGYEIHALRGGVEMIRKWKPVIQVECLNSGARREIDGFMVDEDYYPVKDLGRDVIFAPK